MVRLAASLLLLLAVCGCATRYPKPVVQPAHRAFSGIAARLQQEGTTVRVLFVHGMCSQNEKDWITEGWDVAMKEFLDAEFRSRGPQVDVAQPFQIVSREYDLTAGRKILASFIIWSKATEDDKKTLWYDRLENEGGQFPLERAALNNRLKRDLVNDCLSDAVIYAGYRSQELRDGLKEAFCRGIVGCMPDAPLIIVTESLGSKMTIDALKELAAAGRPGLLRSSNQLFMMANQLPLLGLAFRRSPGADAGGDRELIEFRRLWNQARAADGPGPVRGSDPPYVVAFTDPNDLLSYRLRPDDSTSNVLGSNTRTYVGQIADPNAAHTTYERNREFMRLVLCGYPDDGCRAIRRP